MKLINAFFTVINISPIVGFSQGIYTQVLNDDNVNITAVLKQGYGRCSPETTGGGSNPSFNGKIAEGQDNTRTLVLNTAYSTDHNVELNTDIACFTKPPTREDECRPLQTSRMGFIKGSTTGRFD